MKPESSLRSWKGAGRMGTRSHVTLSFYPLVTKFLQNDTFCWDSPFTYTHTQRRLGTPKNGSSQLVHPWFNVARQKFSMTGLIFSFFLLGNQNVH